MNYYHTSEHRFFFFVFNRCEIFRIERCTQIQTILRPISKDNPQVLAMIEFYNQEQFMSLMESLPREKDETNDVYEKRAKYIRQLRQNLVSEDRLIQEYRANDDNERRRIIQKLHEYIADISYLNIVKDVTIYTNKLPGNNDFPLVRNEDLIL